MNSMNAGSSEDITPVQAAPPQDELRAKIQEVFNKRPCDFQYKLFEAQKAGKNVISIARTGSGKTLTYFMPLVLSDNGVIIIVTALNVLGEQFEREARAVGYTALSVNGENESDSVFRDIKNLKYRVLIFSPDIMMKRGGRCQTVLWPAAAFVSKIQRIIFDEAHCVLQWGSSFRPKYKAATNITFYLPNVPIYLSSATMPPAIVSQLKQVFRLTDKNTVTIQRSNDRPNIAIVVRRMEHPQDSFEDLAFLVPKDWKQGDPLPPKFMVFFDNKKDAEGAAKFLQSRISVELRKNVPWFHAGMTKYFRVEQVARLRGDGGQDDEAWGFMATDSGGLGLDIPNICIVVQFKATMNLDTVVQCFGRAVRDVQLQGVAILIAEPHWFYEDLLRREKARQSRQLKRKTRSINTGLPTSPTKRPHIQNNVIPDLDHAAVPESVVLSPSRRVNRMQRFAMESEQPHLAIGGGASSLSTRLPNADELSEDSEGEAAQENTGDHDLGPGPSQAEIAQVVVEDEEIMAMIMKGVGLRSKSVKSTSSRPPRVPDRGTCLFINAHNLATKQQQCRRWHTDHYYANHLAARDSKTCCERCEVKAPTICCDTCHPDQVAALIPARNDSPPPRSRKPRRTNIKSDSPMSTLGKALYQALMQWREQTAAAQFGENHGEFGGRILIHSRNIERIVELAQADKLKTVQHLRDQTGWAWTAEYGDQVINLVRQHFKTTSHTANAPPPMAHISHAPGETTNDNLPAGPAPTHARVRALPTCSLCGEIGHRRNSGRCPVNITARRNENSAPTS